MLDSCIRQSDLCMLYHNVPAYYSSDKRVFYCLIQLLKAEATFLTYILRPLPSMSLFFLQCKIVVVYLTTFVWKCKGWGFYFRSFMFSRVNHSELELHRSVCHLGKV